MIESISFVNIVANCFVRPNCYASTKTLILRLRFNATLKIATRNSKPSINSTSIEKLFTWEVSNANARFLGVRSSSKVLRVACSIIESSMRTTERSVLWRNAIGMARDAITWNVICEQSTNESSVPKSWKSSSGKPTRWCWREMKWSETKADWHWELLIVRLWKCYKYEI